MMTQSTLERYGYRRSALLIACLFLIGANACSKSETESASKTVSKTLDQVTDSAGKVTEKTKDMAKGAINSAQKMVDDAKEGTKDAYDAAGNAIRNTAEKAGDTYKAAEDKIKKTVSQMDNAGVSESGGDHKAQVRSQTEDAATTVQKSAGKALDNLPSLPGK